MARTPRPRRAAAGAGAAVVLAAGAVTGLVVADLERTLPVAAVAEQSTTLGPPTTTLPALPEAVTPTPSGPTLRSAPAPQNPPSAGVGPDATTRAS